MLEINSLSKKYANGKLALSDISFSLKGSEMLAIVGSSGAGKSTLLKCINRLEEYEGSIKLDGLCIEKLNSRALRRLRCNIAMIFQNYNLVENLSVIENVLHGTLGKINFFRALFGLYTKAEKEKATYFVNMVGMRDFLYRPCFSLSGGEKQRVGIARSFMQEPTLVLADEPSSSLDIKTSNAVLSLLKNLCKKKGVAIIVNLHQIDLAKRFADRIIALKDGKIIFSDIPSKLDDNMLKKIF